MFDNVITETHPFQRLDCVFSLDILVLEEEYVGVKGHFVPAAESFIDILTLCFYTD